MANLLNLEVNLLFRHHLPYWRTDRLPDELIEAGDEPDSDDRQADHGRCPLVEAGTRAYSKHSKDHRPDLPQVVIGMAVVRWGIPVRMWTFGGTTSDQKIIRRGEGRPRPLGSAPGDLVPGSRVQLRPQPPPPATHASRRSASSTARPPTGS